MIEMQKSFKGLYTVFGVRVGGTFKNYQVNEAQFAKEE